MCVFLCKVASKHKPPTSSGAWWRRQLSVLAQEETVSVDGDGEMVRRAPGQSLPEELSRVFLTH